MDHFYNQDPHIFVAVVVEEVDAVVDMVVVEREVGLLRRAPLSAGVASSWVRAMAGAGDRKRFLDCPSHRLME